MFPSRRTITPAELSRKRHVFMRGMAGDPMQSGLNLQPASEIQQRSPNRFTLQMKDGRRSRRPSRLLPTTPGRFRSVACFGLTPSKTAVRTIFPPPTPGTTTSQRGPFSRFTTYNARFGIAFSLLGTDGIWESGLFMKTKSPPPKTGAGLRPIAWYVSA